MIEPNMKTTIENDSKKEASATSDSLTGESTLDKHAPQKPSMIEKLCIFIEKKWKIGLIATALLLTIVPLFVGWFAPHCKSEITADGILEYIVGALSFASTLALSALALWQTQKIQTESDKAQEEMKELSNRANELNLITKVVDFEQLECK